MPQNSDGYGLARFFTWVPVILLHGVLLFFYVIYMGTYMIPITFGTYKYSNEAEGDSSLAQIASLIQTQQRSPLKAFLMFLVFHILIVLFYVSFLRSMSTLPGFIPQIWKQQIQREIEAYLSQEREQISKYKKEKKSIKSTFKQAITSAFATQKPTETPNKQHDLSPNTSSIVNMEVDQKFEESPEEKSEVEVDDDFKLSLDIRAKMELLERPGRRFCKKCMCMKPLRTHHCSQCKVCWLKMDHHCQWVNNCIGYKNYKYFFTMIFYASISLCFMTTTYSACFWDVLHDQDIGDFMLFTVVLNYYFTIVMCLIITGFTIFHIMLVCRNKTTLEFLENKEDARRGDYDLGFFRNIDVALGNSILLWLLPANPGTIGQGVDFSGKDYVPLPAQPVHAGAVENSENVNLIQQNQEPNEGEIHAGE